jgi:hypothetical protein
VVIDTPLSLPVHLRLSAKDGSGLGNVEGARLNRARLQLPRSKQSLARLEHHPVVYFKQFVNEEPRAIGRTLQAVAIFKYPIPVDVLDCALESAELVVFELDIAGGHATDLDLLAAFESENLI